MSTTSAELQFAVIQANYLGVHVDTSRKGKLLCKPLVITPTMIYPTSEDHDLTSVGDRRRSLNVHDGGG